MKNMKKKIIIAAAALALVLIIGVTCMETVPTGYTGILTTFGRVEDRTLEAGLHMKTPFQQIVNMDNREQKTSFVTQAFSSDIQQVDVTGSINYAINKTNAMNLFKEVGTDYFNKLISPRMLEVTKGVFSKYTAENLVAFRQNLSESIRESLVADLEPYGIHVISINIENIDFTDAFTDAVEAKQVAAQRKLQAEIEEAQKTMETQQAAERQKINAEAEAAVAKINADAEAYATRVRSEAEAEANRKIAESLTKELISFNEIKEWDGRLPTYVGGEGSMTLPILNLEQKEAAGE
ncbi:MAG: prohibitin family protein [Clostridia bacterium]|nr:prohibitin family protein [Clostridia bacterium]MBR0388194.1 prohibitin family protein [Clostridia bacterium]MBR2602407.1 prohibitin family protein [Clostridia bacterium]MBR7173699.1 prohibitin family protein [Clostridia bacterium]